MVEALVKTLPLLTLVGGATASSGNIKAQIMKLITATEVIATQTEVNSIAKMVYLDVLAEQAPKPEDFQVYLQKNMSVMKKIKRDTSRDFWGMPYGLVYDTNARILYVISAGPDKQYNTDDDVFSTMTY